MEGMASSSNDTSDSNYSNSNGNDNEIMMVMEVIVDLTVMMNTMTILIRKNCLSAINISFL